MTDIWGNMINGTNNFGYGNNFLPRYKIIRVHGEEGARSIRMAPDSETILVDDRGGLIWLAQTDGAGYLTVTPYDVTLHQVKKEISLEEIAQRLLELEEKLDGKQPVSQPSRQSKKQQSNGNTTV